MFGPLRLRAKNVAAEITRGSGLRPPFLSIMLSGCVVGARCSAQLWYFFSISSSTSSFSSSDRSCQKIISLIPVEKGQQKATGRCPNR